MILAKTLTNSIGLTAAAGNDIIMEDTKEEVGVKKLV